MEKRCKYGITLEQCNRKFEPLCDGDNHDCELEININQKRTQ